MVKLKIIDLSVSLRDGSHVPRGRRLVEVKTVFKRPGFWQASWISMSAHTGSHVDSPLHVIKDAPTIGQIEIDRFVGEAVILDLTDRCMENYEITVDDLLQFENRIKENDIVILYTGWSDKNYGLQKYWDESPYITVEAAEWICAKNPKAIGFDFFQEYNARYSDFNPDDFEIHKAILGKGVIIMEHFINLGKIQNNRFQLFAVPLKIVDTEASPARFFAIE